MPLYEYQCNECEHNFELKQGFDAEPICDCPACSGEARRLFKPAPIIFKGSGFYVTDYNGKSPSHINETEETKPVSATKLDNNNSSDSSKPASSAVKTDS